MRNLLFLLILCMPLAYSFENPFISYSISPIQYTDIGESYSLKNTEIPFRTFYLDDIPYMLITNRYTLICKLNDHYNFDMDSEDLNCLPLASPEIMKIEPSLEFAYLTAEEIGPNPWIRMYNGVYDIAMYGDYLYLISHAENKNEMIGSTCYASTIRTEECTPETAAGNMNGFYKKYFPAYASQVVLFRIPISEIRSFNTNLEDSVEFVGVLTWPSNGYLVPEGRIGPAHPFIISNNGYLYIYYSEAGTESGNKGIKLVRVPISDPSSGQAFSEGGFNNPNIPSGVFDTFTLDYGLSHSFSDQVFNPITYQSGDVWYKYYPDESNSFSVAKLTSGGYLGVEQGWNWNYNLGTEGAWTESLMLRYSDDLINWSEPLVIKETEASRWGGHSLQYPRFMSSDLKSHTLIDSDDFYILGADGGSTNYIQVSLKKNIPTLSKIQATSNSLSTVQGLLFIYIESPNGQEMCSVQKIIELNVNKPYDFSNDWPGCTFQTSGKHYLHVAIQSQGKTFNKTIELNVS